MKNWLIYLIIFVLTIGIFFRVTNIDKKLYWDDEVFTSLRVSGYNEQDVLKQYNGSVITVEDLQKYQRTNDNKSLIDTLKSLTVEGAQHPPFYFMLVRFWSQLWGNSIITTRSVSVIFSLLAFPCLYFLCRELFTNSLTGWVAMGLLAVSPFNILYSQAARQYSLWTVVTLLSTLALVRAIRLTNIKSWGIYSGITAISFYTFPFSLFVSISQGIYLLIISKFKLHEHLRNYLIASVVAVISFVPWLIFALLSLTHVKQTTSWLNYSYKNGLPELVLTWWSNIGRIFIDFEFMYQFNYSNPFPYIIILLLLGALVGYSIYYLINNTPKETWLLVVTLIVIPAIALMLPDIILGGRRSGITRYMVPSYLGIQLAISYCITNQMFSGKVIQQKLWQVGLFVILILGILSAGNSYNASIWWHNGYGKMVQNPEITTILNQASKPLVVSDGDWDNFIALTYTLKPDMNLLLVKDKVPSLPQGYSDYFLYKPSKKLLEGVEKQHQVIPVYEPSNPWLWKISNDGNVLVK